MSILSLFKIFTGLFQGIMSHVLYTTYFDKYMISMINATFGACLMTVLITINPIVKFQAR